ncbi:MAG TPA: methyl-accepting chemotaxis protein [Rhodocyclaceae bacterium]|nr:methyl-accepting chemotaxis protein [Rhodocyclaceae bacterium]
MNRFKQLSLATRLAVLAAAIVLIVTLVLALVVNQQLTRFALDNAHEELKRQTESVRALLDLSYDGEKARAERRLQQAARLYNGRLERKEELVPAGEAMVPVLKLNGETLNGNHTRAEEFFAQNDMDSVLMVRKGDEFHYIAGILYGKTATPMLGKKLMPSVRVDMRQKLLAGESVIDLALRDGKYVMVGYAPLKDAQGQVIAGVAVRLDLEKAGLQTLREQMRRIKIAKTGYLYAIAPEPKSEAVRFALHPKLEGKTDADLPDYVKAVTRLQIKEKEGSLTYDWPTADGKMEQKMMLYIYSDKWDWVIGATGTVAEFTDSALRVRNLLMTASAVSGLLIIAILVFALKRGLAPLEGVLAGLREVERGNVGHRFPEGPTGSKNEIDVLSHELNATLATLGSLIRDIADATQEIDRSARQQESSSGQVATASEQQSHAASSMASAVEELSVSINQVADHAREAAQTATEAQENSTQGRQVVEAALGDLQQLARELNATAERVVDLGAKSAEISRIVLVIREVADQTNLLALNAAIEAARAGEQGRGFAVVADEVRKLAERTGQSTQEISAMISTISAETREAAEQMQAVRARMDAGMAHINGISEVLVNINDRNGRASEVIRDIAAATQEQSSASGDIARQVEQISEMAESNASTSGDNRQLAAGMKDLAAQLRQSVSRFRT